MKSLKNIMLVAFMVVLSMSCKENKAHLENTPQNEEQTITNNTPNIEKIKDKLCGEFPKDLVLTYNPNAIRLDIERVDDESGGILNCKLKLFYGEKDYEFFLGEISAWINQQENPFWQYNPTKNPRLYQKVEGLGEKAVFIANMYQLQILKDGVLYSITPPNNGRTTDSGIENKAIAIEIAKHYQL